MMKRLLFILGCLISTTVSATLNDGIKAFNKPQYDAALVEFRTLATVGNAEARYYLGIMQKDGLGMPQDKGRALGWLKKSARQGHALSNYQVGKMLLDGDGIP